MSGYSKEARKSLFDTMENKTHPDMVQIINDCHNQRRMLGLPEAKVKNIITAYNNLIIELEKTFAKAGIDFFDNLECETHFALDNYLLLSITAATRALTKHNIILSTVTKKQATEYVDSYRRPSTFQKVVMGKRYEPMDNILSDKQQKEVSDNIKAYVYFYDKVAYFSIEENIVAAILTYAVLSGGNGINIFPERIQKIDAELQKLGYQSIFPIIKQQLETHKFTLSEVPCIESVKIKKIR